ncbi:hypothetical protein BVRB_7g159120 [Beta vulgaris subsp. vulgaris]|nr:hypothetical protein BVRB_7g159120 [Beta vulgaris subsp. vulgaris]
MYRTKYMITILPEEIIVDVLLRLPAKSLMRFKSVCKSWYNLIKCPDFSKLHLERSLTTRSNLHYVIQTPMFHLADFDTFDNPIELNHPYKTNYPSDCRVVGSCNGLLCLHRYFNFQLPLCIYNPTTRTYKLLPFLTVRAPFNYRRSMFTFGFGYDNASKDYKCVRVFRNLNKATGTYESEVMVCSLKDDEWRRAPDVASDFDFDYRRSVFVKDKIHWVGGREKDGVRALLPIVAFSLRDETFSTLPVPNLDTMRFKRMFLGELDGCLCLSVSYIDKYCDVWVMKEYGVAGSWSRLLSVTKRYGDEELERPVCYSMDRKKLFVNTHIWFQLVSIDLDKMEITNNVKASRFNSCSHAYVCAENLLMLEHSSVHVKNDEQ